MLIGFNIASGVNTPVLPILNIIFSTTVSFCSGGYLYATAHLGYLEVTPKISLNFKLFTLITAPSVPKVNLSLLSPISITFSIASSIPFTTSA